MKSPLALVLTALGIVFLGHRFIKEEMRDLQKVVKAVKTEMKTDVQGIKTDIKNDIKKDLKAIKTDIKHSEDRVTARISGLENAVRDSIHHTNYHPTPPSAPIPPTSTPPIV